MIYICTHKPNEAKYILADTEFKMIDNTKSQLPVTYRHLRGIQKVVTTKNLPDEIGIFQYRRHLSVTSIPEGYDAVAPSWFNEKITVAEQYRRCHNAEDLAVLNTMLKDENFEKFLNTSMSAKAFHNMFILRVDDFKDYCKFLFGALKKFEKIRPACDDIAYIAERLGAYWFWNFEKTHKVYKAETICVE